MWKHHAEGSKLAIKEQRLYSSIYMRQEEKPRQEAGSSRRWQSSRGEGKGVPRLYQEQRDPRTQLPWPVSFVLWHRVGHSVLQCPCGHSTWHSCTKGHILFLCFWFFQLKLRRSWLHWTWWQRVRSQCPGSWWQLLTRSLFCLPRLFWARHSLCIGSSMCWY